MVQLKVEVRAGGAAVSPHLRDGVSARDLLAGGGGDAELQWAYSVE